MQDTVVVAGPQADVAFDPEHCVRLIFGRCRWVGQFGAGVKQVEIDDVFAAMTMALGARNGRQGSGSAAGVEASPAVMRAPPTEQPWRILPGSIWGYAPKFTPRRAGRQLFRRNTISSNGRVVPVPLCGSCIGEEPRRSTITFLLGGVKSRRTTSRGLASTRASQSKGEFG